MVLQIFFKFREYMFTYYYVLLSEVAKNDKIYGENIPQKIKIVVHNSLVEQLDL